jgi:hypothetical protein
MIAVVLNIILRSKIMSYKEKLKKMKIEIISSNNDTKVEEAVAKHITNGLCDMSAGMQRADEKEAKRLHRKYNKKLDFLFHVDDIKVLMTKIRELRKEMSLFSTPQTYSDVVIEAVNMLYKNKFTKK